MEFEKKVIELDVNDVLPNRFQPRIKFNEDSINELSDSIKEHGVIQPIVVRAMGDKYEIIAGERRYKASLLAGKSTIPAVITNLNDKDSAEVALIENVQRKDLTPIEEAISYKKILDMGYLTQEELAVKLGKSQSTVANKLRLLNLDEDVQDAVLDEKISERHARSLLKLSDYEEQKKLLKKIIENRLTVRKTDEEIEKILKGNKESSDDKVGVLNPVFLENPFKVNRIEPETLPEINQVKETKLPSAEPIIILDEDGQIPAIAEDDIALTGAPLASQSVSIDPILGIPVAAPTVVEPAAPVESLGLSNTTNPGFMNIEQIENNAQDIIQQAKQPADMGVLLNAAPVAGPVAAPTAPEAPEEELKVGKFFTLPTDDDNAGAPLAQAATPQDAFNFQMTDFSSQTVAPAPVVEPSVPVDLGLPQQSAPAAAPTVSIDALMSMPMEPVPAAPETPEVAPVVTEAPAAEILDVETPAMPAAPVVPTDAPVEETPVIPTASEVPAMPAAPTSEDDFLSSLVPGGVEIPASPVAPAPEVAPAPVVSETSEIIDAPVAATMPATLDVAPTLTVPAPTNSEDMPIPTAAPASVAINTNVIDAVNNVRNCIGALESQGFIVDSEEFDFEGEYQIIIKVKK